MATRKTKTKPILIVDTREKTPWDFETDDAFEEVIYRKLDHGDYSIEGLEDIISIERKASVNELYTNFTKDKKRIKAEFERMKDCDFKFLVVEETCEDVLNPYMYYVNQKKINRKSINVPVAIVASNLTELMIEQGVRVIFGGSKAQSMAKGLLLKVYDMHQKGKL